MRVSRWRRRRVCVERDLNVWRSLGENSCGGGGGVVGEAVSVLVGDGEGDGEGEGGEGERGSVRARRVWVRMCVGGSEDVVLVLSGGGYGKHDSEGVCTDDPSVSVDKLSSSSS
jgi:hypothetical protein